MSRFSFKKGDDSVFVRIANAHTNVVLVEKNGVRLFEKAMDCGGDDAGLSQEKSFCLWEVSWNLQTR